MNKSYCMVVATLLGSAGTHALASSGDTDAFGDYFSELPVVLSASRLMQPTQEAPAAVTVIDQEMIRASGARQIAELFRLVPGFLVTYRNGHSPMVTYHGLADSYARRLQVMIDGVSIYTALYGGVEWYDLPISVEDVERIEIVRGPNGASFGANAFVGMVNIITREPAEGDPADIAFNSGSNGVNDLSMRYVGGHDNLRFRLSLGERGDRGFDAQPDSNRVRYLNMRGYYRFNATNELSGTFLHSNGVGTEYSSYERPSNIRSRHFEQNSLQLRWTKATGNDEFWLQAHHWQRRQREAYLHPLDLNDIGLGTLPIDVNFNNDQQRDELEFQHSLTGDAQWRAVWGGQVRRDAVRSNSLFGRPEWISNRLERVFASVEWRPDRHFLLHAGGTYEHSSLSGSSRSPRMSATVFLAEGQSLRFGVSKARRAPVLFEEFANSGYPVPDVLHAYLVTHLPMLTPTWNTVLYQQYLSSGNLRDERILSREVAYQGNWPGLRLAGEVRVFSDQVEDLIYVHRIDFPTLDLFLRRLPNPTSESITSDFRNLDRATVRGIEGSFRWTPWQGANLIVAATRTVIEASDIDAQYGQSAPTSTASTLFSQQLPWQASLNLAYYRVGSMQWLGGGEPLPAYERVDVGIGKRFRWGQHAAELSWITQNVFNDDYPDFQQMLRNKRISWLRCQYSF